MIGERATVTATAIGVVALLLSLAAPASATSDHDTKDPGNHKVTETDPGQTAAAEDPPSTRNDQDDVEKPAPEPPDSPDPPHARVLSAPTRPDGNTSDGGFEAGHDKCRKTKDRRLQPWCTDPGAGWLSSTTLRGVPNGDFTREMCEANRYRPSLGCEKFGLSGDQR